MIDEDVLRRLLDEAADAAPAPGRAPDELLEALAERESVADRPRRSRARVVVGVAAALLALLVGVGALVDWTDTPDSSFARSQPQEHDDALTETTVAGAAAATAGGTAAGDDRALPSPNTTIAPSAAGAVGSEGLAPNDSRARAQAGVPADSAKVIRTGSIDLEVVERGFESTVDRITSMVVGLGGYVAESTTTESGDAPRGSITVRVPASSFDQLVLEVRKLGEVQAVTAKGTDVTAQFSDLAARLSALSATRERLFEVLRGARNVGDIIAVQDRITGVQTEIEQIQGQQRLLEDQTSFGTLAVTLTEPGAERIEVAPDPNDGLGAAWDDARRRFGDSLEGLVAWSGSAAVVLLVALVVGVLGRLAWVRGRRLLV